VLIPEALIDEYAARMLANVHRGPQAEEEAQHVHLTHVPIPRPHHEHFAWSRPLVTHVIQDRPVDWIHTFFEKIYPDAFIAAEQMKPYAANLL